MLNLRYIAREISVVWRRSRLSFLFSVLVVAFLLILVGLIGVLSLNVNHIVKVLNTEFDIQVFVANTLNEKEIEAIGTALAKLEHVETVDFFSKTAAAEQFAKEFGEELFDIAGNNPLPSSFLVGLHSEKQTIENIQAVAQRTETINGVEDVVYHKEALRILQRYSDAARLVHVFLLVFVIIGSLLIVYHTIRLSILSRRQIVETMKLVGATQRFIRIPYYLQGTIHGVIGGAVAFVILFILFELIDAQVPNLIYVPVNKLLLIIGFGGILGFLASAIAIRKML